MNHFVLDFIEITTLLGLHQYLKKVFRLPDHYGNNMDALWDCLSCCYDESTIIELRNLDFLYKRLEQATQTMMEVFQDLHNEDGVIITISEDASQHSEKCFDVYTEDFSEYMV